MVFGDGGSFNVNLTVTAVDAVNDIMYGTYTTTHTYGGTATSFVIQANDCCRIGGMQNNAGGSWHAESTVQLTPGSTSSPISTMPAIINLQTGLSAATFFVTGVDPDGTPITYALASSAELGGGTQPTGLTLNTSTGEATFNTVGKGIGELYNAMVKMTDGSGATGFVDFIIRIVGTSNPPVFNAPTPANLSTFNIPYGTPFTATFTASDADAGSSVVLTAAGVQTGMSFSPSLPNTAANPSSTNFSWTPTLAQVGTYVLIITATDNIGVQTTNTITLNVQNSITSFDPPTPAQGSVRAFTPGTLITDNIAASNSIGLNVSIQSYSLPGGASMSPSLPTAYSLNPTSTMTWTPAASQWGLHVLSYSALDANSGTANHSYQIIINQEPVFTSTPITSNNGSAYSYTLTATDPDIPYGDEVDIDLFSTLPSWLTYTPGAPGSGTGVLSGTPPPGTCASYTIEFIAEDVWHHNHPDVLQSFTLNVDNVAPVIGCGPMQTVSPGIGNCAYSGALTPPSVTDCNTYTLTQSPTGPLPTGINTIFWTATDALGNTSTCTQLVKVTE